MNAKIKDWLLVLASLIDDVALVALVLLILWLLNIPITWPLIVLLVAIFLASIFIIHKLVIPALRLKKTSGIEGMLGLDGQVIEPLSPTGLIKAGGEYWKARSKGGYIAAGQKVEIIGFEGLTLIVKLRI